MSNLVAPHGGGELKPLLIAESERAGELKRAESLKQIPMTSRESSDVLMLAMGAYTPLDGFMSEADWRGTCGDMKLANGLFWPIPVTLSADQALADSIGNGEEVALVDDDSGEIMAVMSVTEKFAIDRDFECQNVFTTTDGKHPGVAKVMKQRVINLAGPVKVINEGKFPTLYKDLYLRPSESRVLFKKMGWSKVGGSEGGSEGLEGWGLARRLEGRGAGPKGLEDWERALASDMARGKPTSGEVTRTTRTSLPHESTGESRSTSG